MGLTGYYVASVKASLMSQAPDAQLVDITHHIRSFDLQETAFVLRSCWQHFPMGTVHIIGVNSEYGVNQTHLVVQYMSHYFIAADNGILSLLFDEEPEDVYEIHMPQLEDWTFPMRGVLATVAAHLSKGGAIEFVAQRKNEYKKLLLPRPIIDTQMITGAVEYIDKYGNVYCNITQDDFNSIHAGRNFSILLKREQHAIRSISKNFSDVKKGERLAMWSSNGHLLIAINGGAIDQGGGASGLLGLTKSDVIKIQFHGDAYSKDEL